MFHPLWVGAAAARRVTRTAAAVALAVTVIVITAASPAEAHANLLETNPVNDSVVAAAPDAVILRFTEAVTAGGGGLSVFGPDGARADRGAVRRAEGGTVLRAPIGNAGPGTYTVGWRVTSEDGHTISGSFVFHVQRKTGAVSLDSGTSGAVTIAGFLGRWFAFMAAMALIGTTLVWLLSGADQRARSVLRRAVLAAAVLGGFGAVLAAVAAAAEAAGRSLADGPSLLGDFVGEQRTGTLLAVRVGIFAVAAVVVAVRRWWSTAGWVPIAAGFGIIVVTAIGGHAWTTTPRWGTVAVDAAHQAAAGVWAGGFVAMALALPRVGDRARLASRFSRVALAAALLVAVTGTVSGWAQVRSIDALTGTSHGQLLLGKVGGFVVLVVIGWQNRSRFVPAVERASYALRRSLLAEAGVAVAVLGLTAALVAQPPARLAYSRPFNTTATAEDLTLQVTVEPARVGSNDLHLYFFTASGAAAVDAVEIQATVGSLPPRRLTITPVTPNHVSAYGASLTSPGTWTLRVTAVRVTRSTTFTIEVPIR